jgi:hypothetical protein
MSSVVPTRATPLPSFASEPCTVVVTGTGSFNQAVKLGRVRWHDYHCGESVAERLATIRDTDDTRISETKLLAIPLYMKFLQTRTRCRGSDDRRVSLPGPHFEIETGIHVSTTADDAVSLLTIGNFD